MNAQPFKAIVVRDQEKKEGLAKCMESSNGETVRTSGATVVILADQGCPFFLLFIFRPCKVDCRIRQIRFLR